MINFYFSDKDYDHNAGLLKSFDWAAKNNWYDGLAERIINDVDKTEVIVPGVFSSEIFGNFSQDRLSGGVKLLLWMLHQKEAVDLGYREPMTIATEYFGDNCSKWIIEISKVTDVHLKVTHYLKFPVDIEFEGYAPEFDQQIRNARDFFMLFITSEARRFMENKYGSHEEIMARLEQWSDDDWDK